MTKCNIGITVLVLTRQVTDLKRRKAEADELRKQRGW